MYRGPRTVHRVEPRIPRAAPAARLAAEYRRAGNDHEGARELIAEDGSDPEVRAMMEASRERHRPLEEEIRLAMVERDPNDEKNVIVEIRPGAGGDEAGLWAGDLYRMLSRYGERRKFTVEPLSFGDGTLHVRRKGRRRVLGVQVRGRHPPRPARARRPSPRAGSTPRRRRSPCCRRPTTSRSTSTRRSADRRLPQLGPRRPVGQHDRLGGADHAQADRDRRLDAG